MRVIALDLGTRLGYAERLQAGPVVAGTEDFSVRRGESVGMRFLRFEQWLCARLNEPYDPRNTLVAYELVARHNGTQAAHVYGGFLGILQALCERYSVDHSGQSVAAIKRHATGKGNANKSQMLEWARRQACVMPGCEPIDDNAADALALLLLMESQGFGRASQG